MGIILLFLMLYIAILFITIFIVKNRSKTAQKIAIEKLEKEFEKKQQNLEAGSEILISQIKPHFIYNVLNTIKYLCKHNPEEAAVVIDKFSVFLRQSMDSFVSAKSVPFKEEMEILENYIYLEKCRFGDKVEVEYDINNTDFILPVLSVQPMVENAIKHGITKNIGGGKVWVKTYEDKDNHMVEIIDNGVGFYAKDIDKNDGKTHIGIKNTKRRIETMCHGTFRIESEVGGLTKVLMTIPKEKIHG